jgi:hypothetical protein
VSADEAVPPEERDAAWLAACDQALADGAPPADAPPPVFPSRLRRNGAF